jgi:hypothetical protein
MDKNPRISQTENNQNQQEQTSQNLTINPPRYTLIPQRYSPQPKQIQNPNTPVQPPHDETPTRTTTSDIPESSNARNIQSTPRFSFYPEQIIENGVKNCQNSILGKIITEKPIHVSSIQNGLESIWGSPAGLRIQEIQGKILQFFMDNSFDQERILQGNPWIFRNSWLIVKPWDRETDPIVIDFDHAPVWIQLWGLPTHCKTKAMGTHIGS